MNLDTTLKNEIKRDNIIISIEGNIGAGKSTLLKIIKEKSNFKYSLIPEPVEQWQSLKGNSNINILDLSYKDPARWGFAFQTYAFYTRLRIWEEYQRKISNDVFICERSVYADNIYFLEKIN